MTATMFEAKTNLSELVKRAQAGEEVIITSGRERTPIAVLIALSVRRPQRIGFLKHLNLPETPDSVWFDPLPEEELRLWEEGVLDNSRPAEPMYVEPIHIADRSGAAPTKP